MTVTLLSPELRRVLDDLARRLGILERRIQPAAAAATPTAAGGDAFVTVAASDTIAELAANADYVCDGTADQTEIQEAIDSLSGGAGCMVVLLPGTFILSDSITLRQGTFLFGSGRESTTLRHDGSGYAVETGAVYASIAHMTISAEAADGAPLALHDSCSYAFDCYLLQNNSSATIAAVLLGGTGSSLRDCHVVASDIGVQIGGGWDYITVADNYIEADTAIVLDQCSHSLIHNNLCRGAGTASGHGILVQGADDNSILGNHCTDYGVDGIRLTNVSAVTPDRNHIQGNTCREGGSGYGIKVLSGSDNFITNNDLLDSGSSGSFNDAGTGTITAAGNRL